MAEMMRKGLGGMGKMGAEMPKAAARSETKKPLQPDAPKMGDEKTSTITHHADGSHTSQMEGGESMEHPDHLHLMAHIGHHLTGGDAHHVEHHDGMESHHHSVEESGEHHDGPLMGGEVGEKEIPMDEHEMEPSYGGM